MTKSFFIVVPYDNPVVSSSSSILPFGKKGDSAKNKATDFAENEAQLEQRVGVIEQGLVRCGIRVAKLGNEEVVELFYKIFNPGESEKPIHTN